MAQKPDQARATPLGHRFQVAVAFKSDGQRLELTRMEILVWTPPTYLEPEIGVIEVGGEVTHPTALMVMVEKLGMGLEIVLRREASLVEQLYKKPLLEAWRLEKQTSKDPAGC